MKKSFQSFLKTSKYKQLVVLTKQSVVLTQFENILLSQRLRMPMLQIQSKDGLQHLNYPRTRLNQHSNNKYNQGFNILQRVWILQSLNTTWFNKTGFPKTERPGFCSAYLVFVICLWTCLLTWVQTTYESTCANFFSVIRIQYKNCRKQGEISPVLVVGLCLH